MMRYGTYLLVFLFVGSTPALGSSFGRTYSVIYKFAPDPTTDPAKEAAQLLQQYRLRNRVSDEDARKSNAQLIRAFNEHRAGYERSGVLEVYSNGQMHIVKFFAPVLGTKETSPVLEIFDGKNTIMVTGKIGPREPNAILVKPGDHRQTLSSQCERILFYGQSPGKLLSKVPSANGGQEATFAEQTHGYEAKIIVITDSAGLLRSIRAYIRTTKGYILDDEIQVHKGKLGTQGFVPTEFEITKRAGGRVTLRQSLRLMKDDLRLPSVANLIPDGTPMIDSRGDETQPIHYKWDGRLPSTNFVNSARAKEQQSWGRPSGLSGILLSAGLILIGTGLIVRRRPVTTRT